MERSLECRTEYTKQIFFARLLALLLKGKCHGILIKVFPEFFSFTRGRIISAHVQNVLFLKLMDFKKYSSGDPIPLGQTDTCMRRRIYFFFVCILYILYFYLFLYLRNSPDSITGYYNNNVSTSFFIYSSFSFSSNQVYVFS